MSASNLFFVSSPLIPSLLTHEDTIGIAKQEKQKTNKQKQKGIGEGELEQVLEQVFAQSCEVGNFAMNAIHAKRL